MSKSGLVLRRLDMHTKTWTVVLHASLQSLSVEVLAGAAFVAAFLERERRTPTPVLSLSHFRRPAIAGVAA